MTLRVVDSGKPQSAASKSLDEVRQEEIERLGRVRRIRVAYPRLERLCNPQSENFWVLGGRPGTFKTTLLWNLALNAARQQQRVLFVSLEMTPGEMALKAVTMYSGLPHRRVVEALVNDSAVPFTAEESIRWEAGEAQFLSLQFTLRIHGWQQGRSIRDVLGSACRSRFDVVALDHLGHIGRGSERPEFIVLAEAIDRLRALSRGEVLEGYRPLVIANSQLNREIDRAEEERFPRLSDFRLSSRIEHDADVVIGLMKRNASEDENNPMSYLDGFVLKNRDGQSPLVLLWEANGATGLITERTKQNAPPPPSWADGKDS